ncbi:S-adenosyl-L-methionine-dependent methyltransferase [Aulographum hederae CBS 113979]|uniref:S-adenosyl-L-methionine-dependent methyltransferase n=1 Tax=Aulographum hederae CBS 113979 TaxID=1176131 RepID=A0A6G1GRD5_9PEZI|nr:S-adenosyl-L-methionine-dependent methyltransferase [Aulographum hederae CBS 113979]
MTDTTAEVYFEQEDFWDRSYQKYSLDNRIYCLPVDEEEEERLDQQHRIFTLLFDDELFFPPIEYPRRILDCGYGQASWTNAMAEMYYESRIDALDIFPADLAERPDNVDFQIWDLNHSLAPTFSSNTYDLIHSRCVAPGIRRDRWRRYVRDLARLLRRNGWVQLVEYYYIIQSDSGRLTDEHALRQWDTAYRASMDGLNREPRVGRNLAAMLRSAGLSDIQERTIHVPIGGWQADTKMQAVGMANIENIGAMLEAHALWPFIAHLGWTKEHVNYIVERAKVELEDLSLRLYIPL